MNVGNGVNFPKDLTGVYGCGAGGSTLTTRITGGVGLTNTLTYFWERSPNNSTWELIPGTTEQHPASGTYEPKYTPQDPYLNYYYRLGVSNNGCVTYTNSVRVVITEIPVVNQPNPPPFCNNSQASVTYTGTNVTSYSWTNDNTAIGLPASGTRK